MKKYVQNPDRRNELTLNRMEDGTGKIIYTAKSENQQKNPDMLQRISFHKTSAVLRMKY